MTQGLSYGDKVQLSLGVEDGPLQSCDILRIVQLVYKFSICFATFKIGHTRNVQKLG